MAERADPAPGTLRIERVLPASPERVFSAWTDPAEMGGWLSPVGTAQVVADVRVGGRFTVAMVGDVRRIEHESEYPTSTAATAPVHVAVAIHGPRTRRRHGRARPCPGRHAARAHARGAAGGRGQEPRRRLGIDPRPARALRPGPGRGGPSSRRSLLMAAVDVVTEIVIALPREEVASYAADPDHATTWYRNITSVSWRTPPPLAVGSQLDFVARFLGRQLAYTYEVTELVPGERLVQRTSDGPFPMETTSTWEDDPDGTRMTLRNRGEPAGFAKVAGSTCSDGVNGLVWSASAQARHEASPPTGAARRAILAISASRTISR